MLELPEAVVLAAQITQTLKGKQIAQVVANQSPHAFAWYTGDPAAYPSRLVGKVIGSAEPYAGQVEIKVEDYLMTISTSMRYYQTGEKLPKKHQLLITFEDGSSFCCTVQMWGCMLCFPAGENHGMEDYRLAKIRPSPLSDSFRREYFNGLFDEQCGKLSAKEFLATKQRIPGLGNGVLQDILWTAKIHPRRKMAGLSDHEIDAMYTAVVNVMRAMARNGGRDTEKDLFGCPGGYTTVLSKNTLGKPCPECGSMIIKEPYMGGAIYYCELCQKL